MALIYILGVVVAANALLWLVANRPVRRDQFFTHGPRKGERTRQSWNDKWAEDFRPGGKREGE